MLLDGVLKQQRGGDDHFAGGRRHQAFEIKRIRRKQTPNSSLISMYSYFIQLALYVIISSAITPDPDFALDQVAIISIDCSQPSPAG